MGFSFLFHTQSTNWHKYLSYSLPLAFQRLLFHSFSSFWFSVLCGPLHLPSLNSLSLPVMMIFRLFNFFSFLSLAILFPDGLQCPWLKLVSSCLLPNLYIFHLFLYCNHFFFIFSSCYSVFLCFFLMIWVFILGLGLMVKSS